MRHHNGTIAVAIFHTLAHHLKDGVQCVILADRAAQRVVRVDTVERQRFRLEVSAFKWFNVEMQRRVRHQPALLIHFQRNCRYFEQGIRFGIESSSFYIDNHGIKPTKTVA